jgi:hypothetical protein
MYIYFSVCLKQSLPMQNKYRTFQAVKAAFSDWFFISTGHGLPQIAKQGNLFLRVIWAVFFVLCDCNWNNLKLHNRFGDQFNFLQLNYGRNKTGLIKAEEEGLRLINFQMTWSELRLSAVIVLVAVFHYSL